MEIANLVRPASLEEAWKAVMERHAVPIGGGAWLRMGGRRIETAVDLSTLDLRYIRETAGLVEIGAMATARDVERSDLLRVRFGAVFSEAVARIVGVQLRNIVTVGGTVAGRYGFSELNTAFLAMDARVVLHGVGPVDFENFLSGAAAGHSLVEKIVLEPASVAAAFKSVRNTKNDLPILNAAAAFRGASWRIAVGARPGSACLAPHAAALLGAERRPDTAAIAAAAEAAAEELSFGDDIRSDAGYRRTVCAVLVRRALEEVSA